MGKNNIATQNKTMGKAVPTKSGVIIKHAKNTDTCLNDSIGTSSGKSKLNALVPLEHANAKNDRMIVEGNIESSEENSAKRR